MEPEIAMVITCIALLIWDKSRDDEREELADKVVEKLKP